MSTSSGARACLVVKRVQKSSSSYKTSFEFKNFTQTLNYTEDKNFLIAKIQNKKQRTCVLVINYHRPRALLLLRAERERESDDGD